MTSRKGGLSLPPYGWQEIKVCTTLIQVHEALVRLRPAEGADQARWLNYHLRSAASYEHIADVDRGHHHEALYWAQRERRKANAIAESGSPASVGDETGTS